MGVFHFMGLGRAVGAVSCAVDYVERLLDEVDKGTSNDATQRFFRGSGGINHEETDSGKIEAIVCFTSREVIGRELNAFSYEGCENPGYVRDELESVLGSVWRRKSRKEGRKIYWCEVDIDNFSDCFEKVLKVTYRFSPNGKQGKEIWCNLTGGSNSIGLSLLSMARLTGKANKCYLLSQTRDVQKCIRVPRKISPLAPNQDSYLHILPFFRTRLDTLQFYEVLMELNKSGTVQTSELLSRLKNKKCFLQETEEFFCKEYMLRLFGLGYIEYDQSTGLSSLTKEGRNLIEGELQELENEMHFSDFVGMSREKLDEVSKNWEWLTESIL